MYSNLQKVSDPEVQELRFAGGLWLKGLREMAGLSQRELAHRTGITYYTFISQLENGRGRLPPDRYEIWAEALEIEVKVLVRGIMKYYDPITYRIIFEEGDDEGAVRRGDLDAF